MSLGKLRALESRYQDYSRANEETPLSKAQYAKRLKKLDEKAMEASEKMDSSLKERQEIAMSGKDPVAPSPKSSGMSTQGKLQMAQQLASVASDGAGETNSAASAGMGAMQGASMGLSMGGGAVGAGVGAVVGGTIGLLKARSARKKAAAEAQAKSLENIAQIRQIEAGNIGQALEGMRAGFQSSLIRPQGGIRF